MTKEPERRKAYVFIDGQNFYLSAKSAFSLRYPSFDPKSVGNLLAQRVIGEDAAQIAFYTGMPVQKYSPMWSTFWNNKIHAMEEDGIITFTRPLRYVTETDPSEKTGFKVLSTREKGIDMRIGLDIMEATRRPDCTDIIIVSRDQDFREVVDKINDINFGERRDIKVWSAYPDGGNGPAHLRGIDGTQEIVMDREDYAKCIDPTDYRSSRSRVPAQASSPSPT